MLMIMLLKKTVGSTALNYLHEPGKILDK